MARVTIHPDPMLSRRAFLATTGGALAGTAACGLVGQAEAVKRQPQRGGTLRLATRGDAAGLDPHRNTIYLVSNPLAATTQGLLDLNLVNTKVNDAGMVCFKDSKNLTALTFGNTPVSDAGLANFKGMRLRELYIDNTGITDLTLPQRP